MKRGGRIGRGTAAAATMLWTVAAPARAQIPPRPSDGVVLPSQSLVSTDTAAASAVNPANLAFLPGYEARFTVLHTGDVAPLPLRGYALDLAVPLWILATGLRIDWMSPPDAAPPPFATGAGGSRYTWVRWANAIALGEVGALGTSLSWSRAEDDRLHDLFSVSSSLTLRPVSWLGAALAVRDWNTPDNGRGTRIEPSVDLGAALRPLSGRRQLEVGLEASYRSDVERWVPGATLSVDVPYVGTLRGGARLLDPKGALVVASAGLDVNLSSLQAGGGAVFGSALGQRGTGLYLSGALRGFDERPRIPSASRVVRIRFEATPDTRQHLRLLRRLWQLGADPEVDGVLLVMRTAPADSLAHAEELVDALRLIKERGKKVLCHLEDAGGRELFVCSEADRIAINPAGGVRFAGVSSRYFYLGGLLDKLGVRADFVRIGAHKAAPEQLTAGPSEVALRDHHQLIDAVEQVYLEQLAAGRRMELGQARRSIGRGPFIATEARDARLVDQLAYEDEMGRFVDEAFGHEVPLVDLEPADEAPTHWRAPSKVAVVYLDGTMVDGESRSVPLVGMKLCGSYTIAKALRQAREDGSVGAVVLRIETGGGSSLASDVILREAMLTAKAKPLVVSMGTQAASGGYYAAVAAKEIFANRATVTGSIGIFYGKVDVAGLLDKLGVRSLGIGNAPRADAESVFRPFTDEERDELGRKVKQFYDLFVGRVAEGRKLTPAEVHAAGQGRAWTGVQAAERKLVDRIGGLRQALARARELASLPADAPIVELPVESETLFEKALKLAGVPGARADEPAGWVPGPLLEVARVLVPLALLAPYRPLAYAEVTVREP